MNGVCILVDEVMFDSQLLKSVHKIFNTVCNITHSESYHSRDNKYSSSLGALP